MTTPSFLRILLALCCAWVPAARAANPALPTSAFTLWYDTPAKVWMTEALPIGNGALGGMIFGGTDTERIQFNVNSLWLGDEKDTGMYQAFGDLFIDLKHQNPTAYRRELDINRAVSQVGYEHDGVRYQRTAFASHPARAMVVNLTASKPGSYSGRVRLTDSHSATLTANGVRLQATGKLSNGMEYESQVLLLNQGGKVSVDNGSLKFDHCNSLTILLTADTNYLPDYSKHWRGEHPHRAVTERLDAAAKLGANKLLLAHVADYQSLFRRFSVDVGTTAPEQAALPTDQRLFAYTKKQLKDPDLEELFCQYGRYLMISCSRPGGLPANLQGLWNENNTPMWRCDYHSNINVQMNYWPVESTNLSECHIPFIDYVKSLREVRKLRTQEHYGPTTRGWTVQTENGIEGGASFTWNPPGSAWYAQHLWEHFAFTQDRQYLAQTAYPIMKEICQFWEDHLKRRPDGTLVSPDGWSPEHGRTGEGILYDQEIVYDLFTNTIEAANLLGIDAEYRNRLTGMREALLKPKIGKWGQLQEWEEDIDDANDHHRHVSHLFALHPGRQISPLKTPELATAAKVSLNARGDGGTGWSKAWKINFWARLLDGDHSYLILRALLTCTKKSDTDYGSGGGVYPNLLDAHPPFQIDGNFGATAGIAEMLLQSQTGDIQLLPALPSAWPQGAVNGLQARGGYQVGMRWADGKLVGAVVQSTTGNGKCRIRYGGKLIEIPMKPGKQVRLDGNLTIK